MSFPNRSPYGSGSPTPWSPSAGAGRSWTPAGSPRGGGGGGAQPWAPPSPVGRPVTPVRAPGAPGALGGRATPVPPAAAGRSSPALHPPASPGLPTARDGRPMTPQRLFSPSRMMGSPAPQVRCSAWQLVWKLECVRVRMFWKRELEEGRPNA